MVLPGGEQLLRLRRRERVIEGASDDMPAGSRVKLEEVPPPMPNDAVVKVE